MERTPIPGCLVSATPLPSKGKMRHCPFWRRRPAWSPTPGAWLVAPGDPTNWVRRTRESIFGIPKDATPALPCRCIMTLLAGVACCGLEGGTSYCTQLQDKVSCCGPTAHAPHPKSFDQNCLASVAQQISPGSGRVVGFQLWLSRLRVAPAPSGTDRLANASGSGPGPCLVEPRHWITAAAWDASRGACLDLLSANTVVLRRSSPSFRLFAIVFGHVTLFNPCPCRPSAKVPTVYKY